MASNVGRPKFHGFSVTSRAHLVNEDVASISESMAWVLDGATPMGGKPCFDKISDAHWYVHFIDDELRKYNDALHLSLTEILQQAVRSVQDEIVRRGPSWEYPPSAAIAIIRINNTDVEYLRLADVTIAMGAGKVTQIISDSVGPQRELYLAELDRASGPEAVRQNIVNRRRNEMNRQGGYWVLADDPTAVKHAQTGTAPAYDGLRILLTTDGLTRAVETFRMTSWDRILTMTERHASALVDNMRSVEADDQDRMLHPRLGVHDDATGLWLRVSYVVT